MLRRLWLPIVTGVAACSSAPPADTQSPGDDHSGVFIGSWFGQTDTVSRDLGTGRSQETFINAVELDITGDGKNRIRLSRFCSDSDPGPEATVDSATGFTVLPYSCSLSGTTCSGTAAIDGGSGSLISPTLTVVLKGRVLQQATSPSCPADTVEFTLTLTAARDDPREAQLDPITGAWVEVGDYFAEARVHWDPPSQGSPRWPNYAEWQVARLDGGFEGFDLHDNADGRSGTVFLNGEELEAFRFRVRNTNGHAASAFTPDLPFTIGFRAPFSLTVTQGPRDAHLSWSEPPRPQATGLEIEREQWFEDGGVTRTLVANVAPSAMDYVDALPGEGGLFFYRGRWFNASVRGYPFTTGAVRAGLFAPDGLVLVPDRTGVDLHWTNHSQLATGITLVREPRWANASSASFELPPTTTFYRDEVPSPGAYQYSLRAFSPEAVSSSVEAWTVTPMDPALGLESTVVQLPSDTPPPVRDSAGHWYHFANGSLMKLGDPAWVPHPASQNYRVSRPVILDGAGNPHLLGLHPGASPTDFALVHEWFDGSWNSETLASATIADGVPVGWQLDSTRRAVVAFSARADSTGLRVIRWSGSTYVVESPAAALTAVDALHGLALAIAPDGRIEVAVSGNQGILHLEHSSTWTPTSLSTPVDRPDLDLLAGATTVDLFVRNDGLGSSAYVVHRQGAVWSAPQTLPDLCCAVPLMMSASTIAGTRPAALMMGQIDGVFLTRGDDGWSTRAPLGWGAYLRTFGYDPAGKMYGLLWISGDPSSAVLLDFHEP